MIEAGAYTTLKDAAEARGILMGTGFHLHPEEDPIYYETLAKEYSIVTPLNVCTFETIQKERGVYTFDDCIDYLKFSQENGQKVYATHFAWDNPNKAPEWLMAITDTDEMA